MHQNRLPTLFLSHGGGPWPYVESMRAQFAITEREFRQLPQRLPSKPRALLVVTGHWESDEFTVSTAQWPPMEYDYHGFPPHTYQIKYPAPGSPALAAEVRQLLDGAGFKTLEDPQRGFDHGTFVPAMLMYPHADMPVVMLSLKRGYDAAEHIRLGQALAPLRDAGILIIGSGLSYHNMRGFGRRESTAVAEEFESYLNAAVTCTVPGLRNQLLIDWQNAPQARAAHPREDHLIPLMLVAGAAGEDTGRRLFIDHAMQVAMASYEFGTLGISDAARCGR
jgi:aromatic ring-opening dioxygenase catalytic subunit (LigB family)